MSKRDEGALALLMEALDLWAFSDPAIDERAEFDKIWFAKVRALLEKNKA